MSRAFSEATEVFGRRGRDDAVQAGGDQGPEVHHPNHLLREGPEREGEPGEADQQDADEDAAVWEAGRGRPLLPLLQDRASR